MIRILKLIAILYLGIAAYGAYRSEHRLPHRAVNELTNWGQGRAPAQNHCPPGTIRFEMDDGLFLECYRGTTP